MMRRASWFRGKFRCALPVVEGTIIGARIGTQGSRSDPIVGLRLADGERVVLHLGNTFARLVADLAALPPERLAALTLRALHLAERPRALAAQYRALAMLPASLVVVEPDRLINITDLHNAAYCVRQDLLRDMHPSAPTPASARGTLIHAIFKEMLKDSAAESSDLLQTYLTAQVQQLAESGATEHEIAEAAQLHLANLDAWRHQQASDLWAHPFSVRAETFLLAPEIGLKGRLDILLERDGESSLIELKKGQVSGDLPRERHRWQVQGYQALLEARGREIRSATLLYSGTSRGAEGYRIPPRARDLHAVMAQRNALALARATGSVPPPPGGAKCERCYQREACTTMSHLLGWRPPPGDLPAGTRCRVVPALDRTFSGRNRSRARWKRARSGAIRWRRASPPVTPSPDWSLPSLRARQSAMNGSFASAARIPRSCARATKC